MVPERANVLLQHPHRLSPEELRDPKLAEVESMKTPRMKPARRMPVSTIAPWAAAAEEEVSPTNPRSRRSGGAEALSAATVDERKEYATREKRRAHVESTYGDI